MPLQKLLLPPDQAAYAVDFAKDALSVKLDGGRSRFRLDKTGGVSTVTAQWSCNRNDYLYLRAFYNSVSVFASLPFLLDLYLDNPELTEHECNFVPGSMRLQRQRGHEFVVVASIEVKPIAVDTEFNEALIMLVEEYGSVDKAELMIDQLELLTNTQLPEAIGP